MPAVAGALIWLVFKRERNLAIFSINYPLTGFFHCENTHANHPERDGSDVACAPQSTSLRESQTECPQQASDHSCSEK